VKRFLALFVLALALVATPAAGGYPAQYIGDQLPDGTVLEVEAVLVGWTDRQPWGMRDPSGTFYLFGELTVEDGVAVLEFNEMAGRHCKPSIWNPNIEECYAWRWNADHYERHVLAFDDRGDGSGVYVASVWNEASDLFFFEALTVDQATGVHTFTKGAWESDQAPPWIVDSERRTRWTFELRERVTEYRAATRRAGQRSKQ
jgi:hypothetical protein